MSENIEKKEITGFFKNHADTVAIIGVNIAIAVFMLTFMISTSHRVDAANARIDTEIAVANAKFDTMHSLIYQEMKDFHGRLCAIEERNKNAK